MIPLRDDTPRFSTPYITYFLIGMNVLVFLLQSIMDPQSQRLLIYEFAMIPSHVTGAVTGTSQGPALNAVIPLFTSMFLHGSWGHVIGNMWFLWIFGDNIEDYLGHIKYLGFYLLSGVIAGLAQIALNPDSRVPNVGASGAIAGILGAYFVLYPKGRVLTWFPIFFLFYLPAWLLLGFWFVMQFLNGTATSLSIRSSEMGGIAFWAHVGGFVAGMLLIKVVPGRPYRARYGAY